MKIQWTYFFSGSHSHISMSMKRTLRKKKMYYTFYTVLSIWMKLFLNWAVTYYLRLKQNKNININTTNDKQQQQQQQHRYQQQLYEKKNCVMTELAFSIENLREEQGKGRNIGLQAQPHSLIKCQPHFFLLNWTKKKTHNNH